MNKFSPQNQGRYSNGRELNNGNHQPPQAKIVSGGYKTMRDARDVIDTLTKLPNVNHYVSGVAGDYKIMREVIRND